MGGMRDSQRSTRIGAVRLGRAITAVLAATVVASACTGPDKDAARSRPTASASAKTTTPGQAEATSGPSSTRTPRTAKSYDPLLRKTVASLNRYWSDEIQKVYGEKYKPPAGGLYAYSRGSAIPPCGGFAMPYLLLQQNAFYCPDNDFIAWDDEGLFPKLERRYGPFLLSIVLAHEWGHAIQEQSSAYFFDTVGAEQQADCFAGSWAAQLDPTQYPDLVKLRNKNLDRVLSGFVEFRDRLGMAATDFGAHGTAFDRMRAFQDGYQNGAQSCADYEDKLPELVSIPYRSFKERFRGGNMPFAQLLRDVVPDVATYWTSTYGSGPNKATADAKDVLCLTNQIRPVGVGTGKDAPIVSWCADDNVIHYDRASLQHLYNSNGDFGVTTLLALQWAAVQEVASGNDPTSKVSALRAICRVGVWTGTLYNADRPEDSSLSPGDIDEAVRVLLEVADDSATIGSGFERVAAFRTGVLGSPTDCDAA